MKTIMDPWIRQIGYPTVTFDKRKGKNATISQEHFLSNPDELGNRPNSTFKFVSRYVY